MLNVALLAVGTLMASSELAAASPEATMVRRALMSPRKDFSKFPWQEHDDELRSLGDRIYPALGELLLDEEVSFSAVNMMLHHLDFQKSGPFLFPTMPRSDRNVQREAFEFFVKKLQLGTTISFSSEMHDAAVRCLDAKTNADAAVEALLAIGLTGSPKDFPLLRRHVENTHKTDVWRVKLSNAAESALARLGDEKSLRRIERELEAPIPAELNTADAIRLMGIMSKAGFSGNTRFIPFLCRHLDDPPHKFERNSHVLFPPPAVSAGVALDRIVNRTQSHGWSSRIDWKKWRAENPEKCR